MPESSAKRARIRDLVRRAVRRLPAPRDEAALAMLRGARALVRGTNVPAPKAPIAAADERWLRDVGRTHRVDSGIDPQLDRLGTDTVEAAAVRAGWQLVDAYERMSVSAARRVFGHELDAWYAYARDTIPNLNPWKGAAAVKIYQSDQNRLRFRRTMDFVRPGERVFDVGFGRGYLAGLLLRDRALAAYHGIDIVPSHLDATNAMLAANGFGSSAVHIRMGDVYELTREDVAAAGADLVICCEVLEHVPDPEKALRALADALPEGADLLFSVPLHGRLEHVWGHATVFDVARLKAMIERADLYVHHVEPLANTWTIVVASRDPGGSQRVREATARPPVNVSVPLTEVRDFVDVAATAITGDPHERLSFPVRGLTALRLDIGFVDFDHVLRVHVDVHAGQERLGRWTWKPRPDEAARAKSRRFALRPGESSSTFHAERFKDLRAADEVRVSLAVQPGASAEFSLRAAYLPSGASRVTE